MRTVRKATPHDGVTVVCLSVLAGAASLAVGCGSTFADAVIAGDSSGSDTSSEDAQHDADVIEGVRVEDGSGHALTILHPADAECTSAHMIAIATTEFALRDPGTCGAEALCGHAYVTFDGTDCNAAGKPYNVVIGTGGTAAIDLALCKEGPVGIKALVVELRRDDGSALTPPALVTKSVAFSVCP